MKIGIISDTHGMLRKEVLEILKSCTIIIHAGDINKKFIIDELEKIAKVYVVRGNNDKEWAENLPEKLEFEINGVSFFMTHKKKDIPANYLKYDVVVYGHSHKFEIKNDQDTILINPGCCGPRKPNQEITFAIAEINKGKFNFEKVTIPNG